MPPDVLPHALSRPAWLIGRLRHRHSLGLIARGARAPLAAAARWARAAVAGPRLDAAEGAADRAAAAARTWARGATEAVAAALRVSDVAAGGITAAEAAGEAIHELGRSAQSVSEAMSRFAASSLEIETVAASVSEIADRANLLSLAAALAAISAGENGAEFAAVAAQVHALAERSAAAAHEIGALTGRILADARAAIELAGEEATRAERGAESVDEARAAFVHLGGEVEDVAARIASFAAVATQLADEAQAGAGPLRDGNPRRRRPGGPATAADSIPVVRLGSSPQDLAAAADALDALLARSRITE